jgi:DNA repair exonuclease SbcCD ATPase subunit
MSSLGRSHHHSPAPSPAPSPPAAAPAPRGGRLAELANRHALLLARREEAARRRAEAERTEGDLAAYLALAPSVEKALDELSATLFRDVTGVLEAALTDALRDVLGDPDLALKVEQEWKRGAASMTFHVERRGEAEDIMRGQGGSVANVLSTGLRIFALARLDQAAHRRFLVLDEQDCWLRPDLVPRFVRLVHETGRRLGFQVLMISHHDVGAFEELADRIYRFAPGPDGVKVTRHDPHRDAE